jgi:type II secretory pathway component GspD/PulD (secretin)
MPIAAAYQVFLSALKAQGFTAVEGPGGSVRIVPVAEAKASAPVNELPGPPGGGEQVVTQVVIGQHVAVAQLQNVLRPLMSPTSQLSVYEPANALVITDYADNVRRLLRIIDRVDLPTSSDVTVVRAVRPVVDLPSWWSACRGRALPRRAARPERRRRRSPRAATASRSSPTRAPTASCCARTTRDASSSCAR